MGLPIKSYNIIRVSSSVAKDLIVKYHYSHTWSRCKYAIGLTKNDSLVGVAVYGSPVGRLAVQSISSEIKQGEVLELTRLWINDSERKNAESWFISKTIQWLKKHDTQIRVLISYADPSQGHDGGIYRASNWLHQGNIDGTHSFSYRIGNKRIHARAAGSIYGTNDLKTLQSIIGDIKIANNQQKIRYLYILDTKNKEQILDTLKHPIKKYENKKNEKSTELDNTVPFNSLKLKNSILC